jgi:hypothetical protein
MPWKTGDAAVVSKYNSLAVSLVHINHKIKQLVVVEKAPIARI